MATATLFLVGHSSSSVVLVIVATSVGGFGHMVAIVSYMVTATSGLSNDEQGLATGLTSMTQQVGITAGIPILTAIANTRIHARIAHHSAADAVLSGVTFAVLIDAAVVLAGALLVFVLLRKARARTAEARTPVAAVAD